MGSVFFKGIFSLAALAGAAAAGVGISHVYSGSSTSYNFSLVSSKSNVLERRGDKKVLSFDENDTETDKQEWEKKLTQFKKRGDLEANKKELEVSDIEEGSDEDGIKKLKKRCSEIKESNSRAFVKWCMIKKDRIVSAQT